MLSYVAIALYMFLIEQYACAPAPLRLTIDCSTHDGDHLGAPKFKPPSLFDSRSRFDVNSFCELIHNAIPKAVKDGKFILIEQDQDMAAQSDTFNPISVPAPRGFANPKFRNTIFHTPTLRKPRLRIPKLNVPKFKSSFKIPSRALKVGEPMAFPFADETLEEDRMQKLKKGVQKMLHFAKVLGQVDQYLSERMRLIVDKLSKAFAD